MRIAIRALVVALMAAAGLAARGATPSAFERRCIPSGGVAPLSNIPDILGRRALPAGRIAVLGATMDLHHGLLKTCATTTTGVAQDFSPARTSQDLSPAVTQFRVGFLRGGSYDVTTIPIEAYVARVLAGEAARESPPAALEALAVAIRTFALANRGRHRADGFDLCDQTHCQVVRAATAATGRAATATAGLALLFNGAPASIFYSASCGGRTERPSAVWPGAVDPPYLPTKRDDACEGQPEWTADLRLVDLQRALSAAGFRGRLRRLRIAARNESGRVARLTVEGLTPGELSGQDLRMALAGMPSLPQIRSATFDVRQAGERFRFTGHGAGHGVGMCVIGSVRLAAGGMSAAAILERYFPGTILTSRGVALAPPPRVGEEGELGTFLALANAARDELAKALGVTPPPQLPLRVHATMEDYERESGSPWFTLGALVNGEMHFLPLQTLSDRGMLERTLRRQLTRMLTAGELVRRPLWVREGAALHFGDPEDRRTGRGVVRAMCPTDDELVKPVSPGALVDAYARARACVERQLAAGRSWRDIR